MNKIKYVSNDSCTLPASLNALLSINKQKYPHPPRASHKYNNETDEPVYLNIEFNKLNTAAL